MSLVGNMLLYQCWYKIFEIRTVSRVPKCRYCDDIEEVTSNPLEDNGDWHSILESVEAVIHWAAIAHKRSRGVDISPEDYIALWIHKRSWIWYAKRWRMAYVDFFISSIGVKGNVTLVKNRYAVDALNPERYLCWKFPEKFESGLRKTIKWYPTKYDWRCRGMLGCYELVRIEESLWTYLLKALC